MSNFQTVRPPGLWVLASVLMAEEMQKIDTNLTMAINGGSVGGTGGGTYAPAEAIIIGGAGLSVTGPLVGDALEVPVTKTAIINGTLEITGTLFVDGRSRRRARVTLSDANHVVDTTMGDCFDLDPTPAVPRQILIAHTTTLPGALEGEAVEFSAGKLTGSGTQYTFVREDVSTIATLRAAASPPTKIMARFEFTDGAWELAMHSGYDSGADYGVTSP